LVGLFAGCLLVVRPPDSLAVGVFLAELSVRCFCFELLGVYQVDIIKKRQITVKLPGASLN
jgi:hypothetical protein